jgi:hypothetical protein
MPSLIGTKSNQVPTVGDLGTMAFREQDQFYNTQQSLGFKNRIINGAMMIDQRNAGASVTPANGAYTLDRYQSLATQTSKYSIQRNAGAVTPPVGFSYYLGVTSLSAYSVTSSDNFGIQQLIEGFNFADMAWGTANAQTVTLSFWVRSSLTGTFGGALANESNTRSYPFSYAISAANTWEQKSVTIAGDTTGTWVGATLDTGVKVIFGLGTGATLSGTAGAWAGSNFRSATGATSVVGTNGATFYITGVQLEKGSTATSFDYRPYGTELALCQRYYFRNTPGDNKLFGAGFGREATRVIGTIVFPVPMRTVPSALEQTGTASDYAQTNNASSGGDSICSSVPTLGGATTLASTVNFLFASGIVVGYAGLINTNSSNSFLGFSAEL